MLVTSENINTFQETKPHQSQLPKIKTFKWNTLIGPENSQSMVTSRQTVFQFPEACQNSCPSVRITIEEGRFFQVFLPIFFQRIGHPTVQVALGQRIKFSGCASFMLLQSEDDNEANCEGAFFGVG